MHTFLAAVVLMAAAQVGTIQVFVDPGVDVFLDSAPMGRSAGAGLEIKEVAPGEHIVTVRTTWGTSLGMKVNVVAGQITKVPVASLGLRSRARGDDSTVVVQVNTKASTCDLAIGGQSVTRAPAELQIDRVASGPYRVALKCGAKSASMDITLAPGRIITMQADLATGRMKVLTDEPRIAEMRVRTPADLIMALSLPVEWRYAFVATLGRGITPISITQHSNHDAVATYHAPTEHAVYELYHRIDNHKQVTEVNIITMKKEGDHHYVEFHVMFR